MMEQTRREPSNLNKCRFARASLKSGHVSYACCHPDKESPVPTDRQACQGCSRFKSRYIEYPVTVNKIERGTGYDPYECDVGNLCEVRPTGNDKTFVGILLGSLQCGSIVTYDSENGTIRITPDRNPAIFVPELRRVIWGNESWWRQLGPGEDPSGISDADIGNAWYVQLLKAMMGPDENVPPAGN